MTEFDLAGHVRNCPKCVSRLKAGKPIFIHPDGDCFEPQTLRERLHAAITVPEAPRQWFESAEDATAAAVAWVDWYRFRREHGDRLRERLSAVLPEPSDADPEHRKKENPARGIETALKQPLPYYLHTVSQKRESRPRD